MAENTAATDVTRVRFPADAYVIDTADAGEQKAQQGEIKLKHLLVHMTPPGSVDRCLIHWATGQLSNAVPVAEYCLSCEGVGEHVFPPLLSSVLGGRSV